MITGIAISVKGMGRLGLAGVVGALLAGAAHAQPAAEGPKPGGTRIGHLVELTEFENHADPKVLAQLLRRRAEIESRAGGQAKVRYWTAGLCGASAGRLFTTTEFPSGMNMAQARQNVDSAAQLRQWEFDAYGAGLALKSRLGLINVAGNGETSPAPAGSPPHVLQYIEMDVGGKLPQYLEFSGKAQKVIEDLAGKDGGVRRHWLIGWAGEHPNRVISTVEFASQAAMITTIEKVDFSPEFGQLLSQAKDMDAKRVFECVLTETQP